MPTQRKTTRPDPEALAALIARMNWFFAKREVEKQQQEARKTRRAKTTRRAPSTQA